MTDQRRNDIVTFNERYDPGDADAWASKSHVGMILSDNRTNRCHVTGSRASDRREERYCQPKPALRGQIPSSAPDNNPHSATGTI